MKPIASVVTPKQTPESSSTGTQVSINGASKPPSGSLNAKQPITPEEMPQVIRLFQGLQLKWQDTPPGQPMNHGLRGTQLKASLALLKRMEQPHPDLETLGKVIERTLVHYIPLGKPIPRSVKEDWMRLLADQPFASIFYCYERQIRSADTFAPRVGQFLQRVQAHASVIARLRRELERSEVSQ